MTSSDSRALVVGIDGTDDGLRALDWAAHVAAQRGWPLRLVHVYQRYVPDLTSPAPDKVGDQARESLEALAAAMRHLEEQGPAVEARTVSREGLVVSGLLDELAEGRMLALGRFSGGGFEAILLGSTSLACAVRASRPVVIVPPGYRQDPVGGTVVLGIDGVEGSEAAIDLAFDQASARHVRLDVVHAVEAPVSPSPAVSPPGNLPTVDALVSAVEPWQRRHPDVQVRTAVEVGDPQDVLIDHSKSAQILVVGGHQRGRLVELLLGSTAREVIQHAACPVAVAHDRDGLSGWAQMNRS